MTENEKGKKNDGAADSFVFADGDAVRLRCKLERFFHKEQYRRVDCHHGDGVRGRLCGHLRRGLFGAAKGAAQGRAGGAPIRFFRRFQRVYPDGGPVQKQCAGGQTPAARRSSPPAPCLPASAVHIGTAPAACGCFSASATCGSTASADGSAAESPHLYRGMDLRQRPQPQQRPLLHVVRCAQTQNRSSRCQYGAAAVCTASCTVWAADGTAPHAATVCATASAATAIHAAAGTAPRAAAICPAADTAICTAV